MNNIARGSHVKTTPQDSIKEIKGNVQLFQTLCDGQPGIQKEGMAQQICKSFCEPVT